MHFDVVLSEFMLQMCVCVVRARASDECAENFSHSDAANNPERLI